MDLVRPGSFAAGRLEGVGAQYQIEPRTLFVVDTTHRRVTTREAPVMAELNPQPLPPRQVDVTVHVPTEILGNLEAFQKVQASIFDRFGCGECNSGIIIDFKHVREFVVTPELEVRPVLPTAQFEMR
jgi:hypothetical protein